MQIIQFDPDDFYLTMVDLILDQMGLALSAKARNREESEKLVAQISSKKLKPDVAIIEAHMGVSEGDGARIAAKLKELVPDIKIIGFSTYETKEWANLQAIKSLKESSATIIKALQEVTGKTYEITNAKEPGE